MWWTCSVNINVTRFTTERLAPVRGAQLEHRRVVERGHFGQEAVLRVVQPLQAGGRVAGHVELIQVRADITPRELAVDVRPRGEMNDAPRDRRYR
jgi:hypothetical protein